MYVYVSLLKFNVTTNIIRELGRSNSSRNIEMVEEERRMMMMAIKRMIALELMMRPKKHNQGGRSRGKKLMVCNGELQSINKIMFY